jgi:tetratricopeptide (TPR) repeat protein
MADANRLASDDAKLNVDKDRILIKDADVYLLDDDLDRADTLLSTSEQDLLKNLDQVEATNEMGKLKHMRAEIAIRKGQLSNVTSDFNQSETYYRQAISKDPANDQLKLNLAQMLTRRGDYSRQNHILSAASDYEAAFRLYKNVLSQDPTWQQAVIGLEVVRIGERKLGVVADAERDDDKANREIAQRIDGTFGDGIAKFRLGMAPMEVNALLKVPFSNSGTFLWTCQTAQNTNSTGIFSNICVMSPNWRCQNSWSPAFSIRRLLSFCFRREL